MRAVRRLKKKGVQSVAVCFLFSFLNPDHELKIKEIFAQEFPEARLSLSYEVLPQIREFYRLSTTVINAYIQPVMASYLGRLGKPHARDGRHYAQALHHAIQRRRVDIQRLGGKTGGDRAFRPRRRRHRVDGYLRAGRHQQHHHLRHGRHELRCRADPSRQSGDHHAREN